MDIIDLITRFLGIDAEYLALILGIVIAVCNLIGKAIPDSATGFLGTLRKIAKVLGLYIGNRITTNVSANDTARALVATIPDNVITHAASKLPSAVAVGVSYGNMAASIVETGKAVLQGKEPGRPYVEGESPEQGSVVPDEFRTDGPFQSQKKLYTREGSAFKPVPDSE